MATFDRNDPDHEPCAQLLAEVRGTRVVPAPVLVEFDYFAARELDRRAVTTMIDEIRHGNYGVEDLIDSDYQRVEELLAIYADLRVGFVDAAVLAVTERYGRQSSRRSTTATSPSCALGTSTRSSCCPADPSPRCRRREGAETANARAAEPSGGAS